MLSRKVLTFDGPALAGEEWPCFEATGAADGPRLCVLAGVHGCEYSGIAAVGRFMRTLDTDALSGTVVAVPIVSPAMFAGRAAFLSPADGKNPNRCFPGDPDGTYSEQLAHHVFTELIAPSDALVDVHGGDLVEALEPFTLHDESPVGDRARAMAVAYGLPYVVCPEPDGTSIGGTTSEAAAAAGIPAITPEAGGCGLLEDDAIAAHVRGLENVLRVLGMLPGEVEPPDAAAAPRPPLHLAAGEGRRLVAARRPARRGRRRRCAARRRVRSLRRGARGRVGTRGRRAALRHVEPRRRGRRHPARAGRRHLGDVTSSIRQQRTERT